ERACGGGSSRSTAGRDPQPVGSGREAKGLENGLEKELARGSCARGSCARGSCESRVDMSALQPAKPNEINANAATCGTRREQSHSTIPDMITHLYATNCDFE